MMPVNQEVKPASWASAFDNGDLIVVVTKSGYRSQVNDPNGTDRFLSGDATPESLGAAVLDALAQSRFVTPDADKTVFKDLFDVRLVTAHYADWVRRVMAARGYKTKQSLFKKMKHCNIRKGEGVITITPTNHEKLEGWSGDGIAPEAKVVLPEAATTLDVGNGLRLAFTRCI